MTAIAGVDPRTGRELPAVVHETSSSEVNAVVEAAAASAAGLARISREDRAATLEAIAEAIDRAAERLIGTAMQETGFPEAKLTGELKRSSYQFRFFAEVVREGSFLEATIDHAGQTPAGPQPDLRRLLIPLGPVAVYGASNFPFAFSVLGGDTASALAAGNPVVVKAHSSHPETSSISYEILRQGLAHSSAPVDAVGIVYGLQAGIDLVTHPLVKAAGFTGSLGGGEALLDAIGTREEPIPFYGELSSLNPVIVTQAAATARGAQIGHAYAGSLTIGSGQLCTKPGFLLAPSGADGDALIAAAVETLGEGGVHVLLNAGIHQTFDERTADLTRLDNVTKVVGGSPVAADGFRALASLFEVSLADLEESMVHEIFGPVSVVVRYECDVLAATRTMLDLLPSSLTVSLHVADDDPAPIVDLTDLAAQTSGRLVFNGFPTGVSVSWAQTHGGPWPSTNSVHTSVGATAVRRFLRPVSFQDAPPDALPIELTDGYAGIPRRVDGVLII